MTDLRDSIMQLITLEQYLAQIYDELGLFLEEHQDADDAINDAWDELSGVIKLLTRYYEEGKVTDKEDK